MKKTQRWFHAYKLGAKAHFNGSTKPNPYSATTRDMFTAWEGGKADAKNWPEDTRRLISDQEA